MTQAEIVRRLTECLAVYDRVIHPVTADPARKALEELLHDVASDPRMGQATNADVLTDNWINPD